MKVHPTENNKCAYLVFEDFLITFMMSPIAYPLAFEGDLLRMTQEIEKLSQFMHEGERSHIYSILIQTTSPRVSTGRCFCISSFF